MVDSYPAQLTHKTLEWLSKKIWSTEPKTIIFCFHYNAFKIIYRSKSIRKKWLLSFIFDKKKILAKCLKDALQFGLIYGLGCRIWIKGSELKLDGPMRRWHLSFTIGLAVHSVPCKGMNYKEVKLVSDFVTFSFYRCLVKFMPAVFQLQVGYRITINAISLFIPLLT